MNRRKFLKRGLGGIAVGSVPLICGCGKNPVSSELDDRFIDKYLISELGNLNKYFMSNIEAWCLWVFPGDYWDKNEIPFSEIVYTLYLQSSFLSGPFKSEDELRKHYEGVDIKTPWVGIYVFAQDGVPEQYKLKYFYRAPGPNVSGGEWTSMIIK